MLYIKTTICTKRDKVTFILNYLKNFEFKKNNFK